MYRSMEQAKLTTLNKVTEVNFVILDSHGKLAHGVRNEAHDNGSPDKLREKRRNRSRSKGRDGTCRSTQGCFTGRLRSNRAEKGRDRMGRKNGLRR